ncbi:DegV family protein [Clostridiaceae bacterium HSG29]|nr:DegV family protein [Clostridiaceae bacterium HSG29]
MKHKIIGDSSTDLNENLRENFKIDIVPLVLNLGNKEFVDIKGFDTNHFINEMINYEGIPKTACPSPQDFIEKFKGDEDVFVVTLSKKLSGTYNSAELAKQIYLEEETEKFIHVFNSKSASVGQTLIALKIDELIRNDKASDEIVEITDKYIEEMQTFFVAESLDNFIKNGRISKLSGAIASTLNIIPIMGSLPSGDIELKTKSIGKKVYKKLVEIIIEKSFEQENRILGIAHVNNFKRANKIKIELEKKCSFKDIIIVETGGLSSIYCDNQGIIIAF